MGKVFDINKNNTYLNFIIGIANTSITRKINFRREKIFVSDVNGNVIKSVDKSSGAYRYEKESLKVFGLFINPRIEVHLFKAFGVYLNLQVVLNKESNYYSLGVGILLGKLIN